MALTTTTPSEALPVPEAIVTVPASRQLPYGWIAVGLGVLATAALLVALLVTSDGSSTTVPHNGIVDRGSITAIDRAPAVAGSSVGRAESSIGDRNLADPGGFERSIVASDRAAALERSAQAPSVVDRGLLDPGSTDRSAG